MHCNNWIFDMDGTLTDSMTVVWEGDVYKRQVRHWALQVLEQMHMWAPSAFRRASSSRTPGLSSTVS